MQLLFVCLLLSNLFLTLKPVELNKSMSIKEFNHFLIEKGFVEKWKREEGETFFSVRKDILNKDLKKVLENPPLGIWCLEEHCTMNHQKPFKTGASLRSHISKICPKQSRSFKFSCPHCSKTQRVAAKSVAVSHAIECSKK